MKRPAVWLALLTLLSTGPTAVLNVASAQSIPSVKQRSISLSRQFIVYCPDSTLRSAVASYVETAKSHVLDTLGLPDTWRIPIVISMVPPSTTAPNRSLSDLQFFQTEEGPKIEITITLRQEELKEARFPQQVIRALLLEQIYRNRPPPAGEHYQDAPSWLVEGLTERMQTRATGTAPNAALFRQLIDTGRIPPIRDFLGNNVEGMDSTSRAIHAACCANLIDMLVSFPEGKVPLARMVRKIGDAGGDNVKLLIDHFPALGGSEATLERWWTIGIAKGSASDRYLSLDIAESDALIAPALLMEMQLPSPSAKEKASAKSNPTGSEKDERATFSLADFASYQKNPAAKAALARQYRVLTEVGTKVHPLLRPVVSEYLQINLLISKGKTRNIADTIREIESYRKMIVERMGNINDYLNWYEATQMPVWSGAFDNYLRTARVISTPPPRRNDPITRYIDQVELEFE